MIVTGALRAIVDRLAECPEVAAIALGGSTASETSDGLSDIDVYVFTDGEVPLKVRSDLALAFDPAPEIDGRYFGPTDEWSDGTDGLAFDLTYWAPRWFEGELARVIDAHRPSLGYSTAFWHTMHRALPLFGRDGWLADMRAKANQPYPVALRDAIIAFNHPLLCRARSSYRHQIELAVVRDDPVSVNHRLAEVLASLFDIIFAANLALHPGEKRLLTHVAALPSLPADFAAQVRSLLTVHGARTVPGIDSLCDAVDGWLARRGLMPTG